MGKSDDTSHVRCGIRPRRGSVSLYFSSLHRCDASVILRCDRPEPPGHKKFKQISPGKGRTNSLEVGEDGGVVQQSWFLRKNVLQCFLDIF